jgi:hypothetical protein
MSFDSLTPQELDDVNALLALAVHRQRVWHAYVDQVDDGKYDTAMTIFDPPIARLRPVLWPNREAPPVAPTYRR